MSLATRCPTCGTVFRVVHDQLLVSQGWVRCGRCSGVFNATDDLLDMDTGQPVHLPAPPAPPAATAATASNPEVPAAADAAEAAAPPSDTAPHRPATVPESAPESVPDPEPTPGLTPEAASEADTPAPALLLRTPSVEADAPPPAGPTDDAAASPAAGLTAALADPAHAAAPALAAMAAFPQEAPLPAAPEPEFVRAAERQAAWKQPRMRAGALAGALLLALLALAQAGLLWRDSLAAHHPGLAPALQVLCRLAGCEVQAPRRIGQLSVDASGLSRLEGVAPDDPGAPQYRLNLTLRNRAEIPLAAPAVELSLTDATGRLVQRRVLRLADLGAPQAALAPGQELALQALLATGGQSVDGYTVELFYP